jgi:hypothetical protein
MSKISNTKQNVHPDIGSNTSDQAFTDCYNNAQDFKDRGIEGAENGAAITTGGLVTTAIGAGGTTTFQPWGPVVLATGAFTTAWGLGATTVGVGASIVGDYRQSNCQDNPHEQ